MSTFGMLRLVRRLLLPVHRYDAMTCEDCFRHFGDGWRGGAIDFLVATAIWNFVMSGGERQQTVYTVRSTHKHVFAPMSGGKGGVVCLACFDRRARALRAEYRDHLVVLGSGCWMGGTYDGGFPL